MIPSYHLWQKFLGKEERRNKIHLDSELHIILRALHDGSTSRQTSIVEENCGMANFGLDAIAYNLDGICIAQITLVVVDFGTCTWRPSKRDIVNNDDACARVLRDEFLANTRANTAASSCNDYNLIVPVPSRVNNPVVGGLLVELVVYSEDETRSCKPVDPRANCCCPIGRCPLNETRE